MEVFSLKVDTYNDRKDQIQISGQGVVYCEMKGRQNSEADLLDVNLRRQLCARYESENPVLTRFKWECGGLTEDIALLSIDEIISFHRCFYNPSNISIIICGKLNPLMESELLSSIASVLKPSNEYQVIEKFTQEIPNLSEKSTGTCKVYFPAHEDNLGSVGLAWLGASSKDLTKVLSFHVLFKYLRETSSSPLYQAFVQIKNPLATEIDYEIKSFYQTIMTLIFSGVPYHPEIESENGLIPGRIRLLLKDVLIEVSKDIDQFECMIKFCLRSFELKVIELIEDDPYETIISYTIPDLISSAIEKSKPEDFGHRVSCLKKLIAGLHAKPIEYWCSLLNELIDCDPVEVIMAPDVKLNGEIDKLEKTFLHHLWDSGKARVAQIPEIVPYIIDGDFELMTDAQMTPFSKSCTDDGLNLIELPGTGMKHMIKVVNFKRFIPEKLWSYLVLYQEILFQCDVDFSERPDLKNILNCPSDIMSYQLLQKSLNSIFNSYGINFGIENDTFSLVYCEEALTWTITLPTASKLSFKDCSDILEHVATRSIFTTERIKIVAENLYNQIQDLQKDPYEVIESILTYTLHGCNYETALVSDQKKVKLEASNTSSKIFFENEISIFKQKNFLKSISQGNADFLAEVFKCLEAIKNFMNVGLSASSFVQIGSNSATIKGELNSFNEIEMKTGRDNFEISNLPKFGQLSIESSHGSASAIGDITASYMSFVVPCNVLPSNQINKSTLCEYVSISLICQLLSVTEGPIYSAVRGRGLAYDASLTISLWNGLLTFAVNDSNDPAAAFKEFRSLMKLINQEFLEENWNIISEDSLKVAKSALLYQMIEESATPSSMFNTCFKNHLRSIPMASSSIETDPVMEIIRSVTRTDLSKAWFKHFPRMFAETNSGALAVLVVPKSISNEVLVKFEGLINFEIKSFADFVSDTIEEGDNEDSDSEGSEEEFTDDSEGSYGNEISSDKSEEEIY